MTALGQIIAGALILNIPLLILWVWVARKDKHGGRNKYQPNTR
jgi:hypothetical protein